MTDILQAARSYYGMEGTPVGKCEMYTNEHGSMRLVIEIPVTGSDFIAIGERMKAMQEAESHEQPDTAIIEGPTVEAMREAYNALSKAERGKYKSFARYVAECSGGILTEGPAFIVTPGYIEPSSRQVVHVDAPEEPEPVSMDAVWLDAKDCSQAQMMHASDADLRSGRHLVQWAMLTDEQKQKAKEAKP